MKVAKAVQQPNVLISVFRAWADLPLTRKGLVVVALPLFILIGALFTLYRASDAEARAEDDVRRAFAIQRDIYQVHALLAEAASGVRGYLVTGQAEFLAPYEKANLELPETLERLDLAIKDRGVREAYDEFLAQADQKLDGLDNLIKLSKPYDALVSSSPKIIDLLKANKTVLDDLRNQIDVIQLLEGRLLDSRRARVERVRRQYLMLTAVSAVGGVLGSLAAVYLFSTGIVRRVHSLEGNAEKLQKGEALEPFPPGADEIGRLAKSLIERAICCGRARPRCARVKNASDWSLRGCATMEFLH